MIVGQISLKNYAGREVQSLAPFTNRTRCQSRNGWQYISESDIMSVCLSQNYFDYINRWHGYDR